MDSHLDSLFRVNFRPIEKSDPWHGIRREENTDTNKHKDPQQKEKTEDIIKDDTVLSIVSLYGFLGMLLAQSGENHPPATPPNDVLPEKTAALPPHNPESNRAATAANAYETTARSSQPGAAITLADTPPPVQTGPPILLSAEERASIRALLHEVEILAQQGLSEITLRPAENFLQSLKNAVHAALNPP